MPYATVIDVQQLHQGRRISGSSKPSATQVVDFLEQIAGEMDGLLRGRGYSLPIATTATSALKLLEHGNALGAHAMVEQAAEQSDRRKEAVALWEDFQKRLCDNEFELDADLDTTRTEIRHNVDAFSSPTAMFYVGQAF